MSLLALCAGNDVSNKYYKENPMKKNTISLLLNTFLLLSLALAACSGTVTPTAAPTVEPAAAAESKSAGIVTAEGKLLPAPAVELGFAQGGVVAEVLVRQGDTVAAGDVLARLVGIKTVQAQVATAQTQYDQVYNAAIAQGKSKRTQDWYKTQSEDFTLPVWYYDQQEQIRAAQAAVDLAQADLTKAQEKLVKQMKTTGADFIKAETDLSTAQAAYQVAKNLNDRIKNGKNIDDMTKRQLYLLQRDAELKKKGVDPKWVTVNTINKDLRDEARKIFDDAETTLKDAQDAYDDAVSTDGAKDVLKARAQASIAEERYYTAQDYVRVLQTGSEAETVTAAMDAVDQAKAALELYELRAPFGGTVLGLDVKAGEAAVPGVPIAFLADTATWTVETKDLAEIDIARVALGQSVIVKLDALPGEEFPGKVTAIDPVGKEHLGDMNYKVTITLDKVDPRFMWNMTANVDIEAK
jgi:HlyD family secretion protein